MLSQETVLSIFCYFIVFVWSNVRISLDSRSGKTSIRKFDLLNIIVCDIFTANDKTSLLLSHSIQDNPAVSILTFYFLIGWCHKSVLPKIIRWSICWPSYHCEGKVYWKGPLTEAVKFLERFSVLNGLTP